MEMVGLEGLVHIHLHLPYGGFYIGHSHMLQKDVKPEVGSG